MKILALDTAMNGCAAGVLDTDTQECVSIIEPMARGHAEKLVPLVQDVLNKAMLAFGDLDMIATTVGPGAFTGLRIGLSTAKALGLALGVPVVGVTTLDALASAYFAQNAHSHNLLVLIETKRTDFYGQFFPAADALKGEPFAFPASMIGQSYLEDPTALIGDANNRFLALLTEEEKKNVKAYTGFEIPDPFFIAKIAYERRESGVEESTPRPLYLRDADVSQTKRVQRTISE